MLEWLTGLTLLMGAGQLDGICNDIRYQSFRWHTADCDPFAVKLEAQLKVVELHTAHTRHILEGGITHFSRPGDGEFHGHNKWRADFYGVQYRMELDLWGMLQ